MKNIYLLLMVVFATTLSQAQTEKQKSTTSLLTAQNSSQGQRAFLYEFSTDTASYVELSNPVSLNQGEIWDDPDYVIAMPFPFYFMGEKIDSLGFRGFGGELVGWSASLDSEIDAALAPFSIDLIDRGSLGNVSLSPLSYQVMGSLGNQVLVMEWKNVGSYNEYFPSGSLDMHISLQIWLYESDNKIIYHYGPSMIDMPNVFYAFDPGALIGFAAIDIETEDVLNVHLLAGQASNPTLTDLFILISGTPPNGIRYIFTPDISPIKTNPSPIEVRVFPNPVGDILYITCEETMLEATLFSVVGVPLKNIPGHAINGSIDVGSLPSGSYMLQLVTPQGVHVSPIVKN